MTRAFNNPFLWLVTACVLASTAASSAASPGLIAGTGRVDITDYKAGLVNDPSYAKALVLTQESQHLVLITLDAVAVEEIGRLGGGFMNQVRQTLQAELGIDPASVVVNASHCHGIIRTDSASLAVQAVREAWKNRVPVRAGTGQTLEPGISENRRLHMKDGSEVDMRRAYAMPADDQVAAVGPIDPKVGLLRLDREDGRPLALVYHFACHPIMNPPSKGSSADFPGYASAVIEDAMGEGSMAFFVQGCGGDINPLRYKEVSRPADAEPLGHKLAATVLKANTALQTRSAPLLRVMRDSLALPRGTDLEARIRAIETEQSRLVAGLKATPLHFKNFLPLLIQQNLASDFPSHHAQAYLHDQARGQQAIAQQDADNQAAVRAYLHNIQTMEQLARLGANLALLKKHLAQNQAAASPSVQVEIMGLRIGDFRLVTFPGELTSPIGLNIQKASGQPNVYVSGYTNGYIYYAPTTAQRGNSGYAQEDCDSILAPEWQQLFESRAMKLLNELNR